MEALQPGKQWDKGQLVVTQVNVREKGQRVEGRQGREVVFMKLDALFLKLEALQFAELGKVCGRL